MKAEYDFSNAKRGGQHARQMREHGYTTTVYQDDGPPVVTHYPPKAEEESTREAAMRFVMMQLRRYNAAIAEPWHDQTIDLIAYLQGDSFNACPVAVIGSSGERVGVWRKHERLSSMLLAFVWHANNPERRELYAVPFTELRAVFDKHGYLETHSFRDLGGYSTPQPSADLKDFMREHRVTSGEQWAQQVRAALGAY